MQAPLAACRELVGDQNRWLKVPFVFIRPSLDGTYYGMALSVRPFVQMLARKNIEGPVRFFSNSLCTCA